MTHISSSAAAATRSTTVHGGILLMLNAVRKRGHYMSDWHRCRVRRTVRTTAVLELLMTNMVKSSPYSHCDPSWGKHIGSTHELSVRGVNFPSWLKSSMIMNLSLGLWARAHFLLHCSLSDITAAGNYNMIAMGMEGARGFLTAVQRY